MNGNSEADRHATAKKRRQEHVDAVMSAKSRRKLVVAGPGTGKTHLFRQILDGSKNALTLTFVNALVQDLSLELCGLSEVRTLHGFARQQLKRVTKNAVKVSRSLPQVVRQDAAILLGKDHDFEVLFQGKVKHAELVEFYRRRRVFYGYYGFSDMVYAAVRLFEERPDTIPTYSQVVVDEFQDFNDVEVALINLLATKSPVLLAGDDDQALYENLKNASPQHIRQRWQEPSHGYERFSLPYCSRCTRVIVEAANDVVAGATGAGNFSSRIEKPFRYFTDPDRDRESERYPRLAHVQVFAKQIPWCIQNSIQEIANEVRGRFTTLLISPTRAQSKKIVDDLRNRGFGNVHYVEKQVDAEPTLLDGLALLLEDAQCNLGWRVTAKALLADDQFRDLIIATEEADPAKPLYKNVPPDSRRKARRLLKTLRDVSRRKCSSDDGLVAELLSLLGIDGIAMAMESLCQCVKPVVQQPAAHEIRNAHIQATTIPSSKGLAADYVFITHFDDRYFIRSKANRISDEDVCGFLVALTRARRKVFLLSTDMEKTPTFLQWIDNARIQTA